MENKQAHGYTRCAEKSIVTCGHMSHLASDWIEWDGKDMSAFAVPGDGGDGREHEDRGIVRKVEASVQKHWGLPRVVTNLGIPLEEMEAELAQEFSSMKSKIRAGVYDKHRATHKQALAGELWEFEACGHRSRRRCTWWPVQIWKRQRGKTDNWRRADSVAGRTDRPRTCFFSH